jgi:uncharacterized protein YjiS (DUF1127 family)
MIAYAPRHYPAVMLFQIGCLLHDVAGALRTLAQRLDVRIAAWKKAADDRRLLNQMSERELRDIGLGRSESRAFGGGWDGWS